MLDLDPALLSKPPALHLLVFRYCCCCFCASPRSSMEGALRRLQAGAAAVPGGALLRGPTAAAAAARAWQANVAARASSTGPEEARPEPAGHDWVRYE